MNTIIAAKKKQKEEQEKEKENKQLKDSSNLKNSQNTSNYENEKFQNLNNITNNKICTKCEKLGKEIESLVLMKSELEKKYQEEKLKYKILEKNCSNSSITNELNTTISTLKKDLMIKDAEIKHLKEKTLEYKTKYNQSISHFEENKNNIIASSQLHQDLKNNEFNLKLKAINDQLDFCNKENIELKSLQFQHNEEKRKLQEENDKLKGDNNEINELLKNISSINEKLNSEKTLLYDEIEKYKRELEIVKENLNYKTRENFYAQSRNQILNEENSKNKNLAINKGQELIETEINFEKLKEENQKLKNIINTMNKDITFLKNTKNVNEIVLSKQINENKVLINENKELKEKIKFFQNEYNKINNVPKKDYNLENGLQNKNNLLQNENALILNEIKRLTTQNEFLKNYYFNHENELINTNKKDDITKTNEENLNISNNNSKFITKELINNCDNAIKEYLFQNSVQNKEIDDLKKINNNLIREKVDLKNKLLSSNAYINELLLRLQEMENEGINSKKLLIQKDIENINLKEKNINQCSKEEKLLKDIENKKHNIKSGILSNNMLKKVNNQNEEMIMNLNSNIFILQQKVNDKDEYIKELKEKIQKQDNQINNLKKTNESLYKIIHKK